MAEEQVDACAEVLWGVGSAAKELVLDPAPLLSRVAGLYAVAPAVLKGGTVVLAPLPAPLLKEATDSGAAWVLCVTVPMRDLQPLELKHGRYVSVDSALCEQ